MGGCLGKEPKEPTTPVVVAAVPPATTDRDTLGVSRVKVPTIDVDDKDRTSSNRTSNRTSTRTSDNTVTSGTVVNTSALSYNTDAEGSPARNSPAASPSMPPVVYISYKYKEGLREAWMLKRALAAVHIKSFVYNDASQKEQAIHDLLLESSKVFIAIATELYGSDKDDEAGPGYVRSWDDLQAATNLNKDTFVIKLCKQVIDPEVEQLLQPHGAEEWLPGTNVPFKVVQGITKLTAQVIRRQRRDINAQQERSSYSGYTPGRSSYNLPGRLSTGRESYTSEPDVIAGRNSAPAPGGSATRPHSTPDPVSPISGPMLSRLAPDLAPSADGRQHPEISSDQVELQYDSVDLAGSLRSERLVVKQPPARAYSGPMLQHRKSPSSPTSPRQPSRFGKDRVTDIRTEHSSSSGVSAKEDV